MTGSAAGRLVVVSAPSGAGKSTLIRRLLDALPRLSFSVSWTTRAPRRGEVDGVAYHFTDEATFRAKIERGEMLEWAEVHGRLYGTGRDETRAALAAGNDVVLDIDVQGAAQVRRCGVPALSVFVLPPSYDALARRLTGRRTETEQACALRLRNAAREVGDWREFDYVVVNDDLEAAAAELVAIVRAARATRERRADVAAAIAAGFRCP